jgi:glycosyltransferase involved in cell wall biosynthesis
MTAEQDMNKITAAVITYNEENRIERCLRSLAWADEIVIIDSFSTDRTVELCRKYTQKVYQHAWPNDYSEQRTRAHQHAANDWILFLDADEVVTKALRDEITSLFKAGPEADAYGIPRREYFGGRWIKAGGWYPQFKTILYRKSLGEWVNPLHEKFETHGKRAFLKHDILHDGYGNFKTFMDKFNQYSSIEAERTFREGRRTRFSLGKALCKPIERFFGRFIRHKGYKDGLHGFYMAAVIAFNYFLQEFKFYEKLHEYRSNDGWDAVYREEGAGSDRDKEDGRTGAR